MLRSILALFVLLAAPAATAQSSSHAPPAAGEASVPGAVVIVRQLSHVRVALETAEALRARTRFAGAPIEVVVCGKGSEHLVRTSEDAAGLVAEAERLGVRLLACGMSLGNLGIDPADLAEGVDVVPNGLLHAIERQADGFVSVEL